MSPLGSGTGQLVAELDRRRQEMEAEHRELMSRAQEQVATMTRQAERRRRELDEQAERLRRQVETDFEVAMAARRAEAVQALAERDRAAKARADQLIREAREHAHRIVADAQRQVDVLRDAEPLLRPLPEETASEEPATLVAVGGNP